MSSLFKNLSWAILTLIVVSLIFSFFVAPQEPPKQLGLSELAQKINAGEVKQISVSGNDITVTLKDHTAAIS